MKVIVYSTPTCPYCIILKQFLAANRIFFQEIDVTGNIDLIRRLNEKTGKNGVPITEIDGEYVVGFDQQKLREILNI